MKKITILYAQKLMEDLMESSSSSDEDDEVFAVLKSIDQQRSQDKSNEDIENGVINGMNQLPRTENSNEDKYIDMLNGQKEHSSEESSNKNNEIDELNEINLQRDAENSNKDKDTVAALAEQIQEGKYVTFEDKLMNMISERNFKHNFHVSRASAIYLMEKYSLWYCKSPYKSSKDKSAVETDILCYLWFCGNEISFQSVAQRFNISLSHMNKSFKNVLQFLIDELAPDIIKLPNSNNEKEKIATEFEKVAGFPNVLGCVAESYFPVKLNKLAQFCGGSHIYLRGVCDSKAKFINVKTGIPREITDSFLEKDMPELCSPNYHLLGDSKCPIREHLMIPFDNDGNLSDSEKNFNIKLIRTHVKIKNAFGILRSRFLQLKYLDFDTVETVSEFIVSCCVLHNICIDREDFHNEEIYTDVSDRLYTSSLASIKNDEFLSDLGLMKRFELKHVMFSAKS